MSNIRTTQSRIAALAALVAILALAIGSAQPAGATSVSETILPGQLTLHAPSVAAIRTSRSGARATALLSRWSVVDATGSGEGWHVLMQASINAGAGSPADITVTVPQPTNANGYDPTNTASAPAGVVAINGVSALVASARVNEGLGTFDFAGGTLTVNVVQIKDPTVTLAATIVQGP